MWQSRLQSSPFSKFALDNRGGDGPGEPMDRRGQRVTEGVATKWSLQGEGLELLVLGPGYTDKSYYRWQL